MVYLAFIVVFQSHPTLKSHGLQHSRLSCYSPFPEFAVTYVL